MYSHALAISSHVVAKDTLLDLASIRAAQTIDMDSQHAGAFSIQPFRTDLFVNVLLPIKCFSRHLETKLKKN